jgi:hypothetical protein
MVENINFSLLKSNHDYDIFIKCEGSTAYKVVTLALLQIAARSAQVRAVIFLSYCAYLDN